MAENSKIDPDDERSRAPLWLPTAWPYWERRRTINLMGTVVVVKELLRVRQFPGG